MALKLSKKWFNPLYFILNDIIKDETIRTVLIYGGKSSGKTQTVAQIFVKQAKVKGKSSLAFRKESSTIPTTLKESFQLAVKSTRLGPAFDIQDRKLIADNGATITLKGLDTEDKAKGVEGIDYVLIDELDHFMENEYDAFEMSLRGKKGQKIFACWNPVDENSWVKTNLVDKIDWLDQDKWKLPTENSFVKISRCGLFVLIKTTYEDNYFIAGDPNDDSYGFKDVNLIAKYKAMKLKNPNRHKVEVLGEWGKIKFGGEFLKQWDSAIHAGPHEYDNQQAIYLSFDENVNPYFPCGFFQVGRNLKSPRMIYAIAAENPDNTVPAICRAISRKLIEWKHKEPLYIGGDATSKKADVKQEKGHDLFTMIINELRDFNPTRRVLTSNPSVTMSANFFNSILEGNVDGMTFAANEKCRKAIMDFENTKEDKNGKVDKTTIRHPITKISYQPYGHFVDLTRYFLVTTYPVEYTEYQRGDKPHKISQGKNRSKNDW